MLKGITAKLMLTISLLVMVSVSITGGVIYLRLQEQFQQTQLISIKELSKSAENYINQYLFTINNLLVVAGESGILAQTEKSELDVFFERQLVLSGDFISTMYFIDEQGELYGYPRLVVGFLPESIKEKLFPFENLPLFGQTEPYNFPGMRKTLTVYKKIWDPKQSRFIGLLAVNIQPEVILQKITGFDKLLNRSIILYSHTDQLISHNLFAMNQEQEHAEQVVLLQDITANLNQYVQKPVQTHSFQNIPFYSSLSNQNSFGWKVVVVVGEEELYKEFRKLKFFFIVFIFFAMFISLLVGYLFSIYLSRPLLTIVKQMKRVVSGNLSGRIILERNDEIGFLIRNFNLMLDRITELIRELVVKEQSKKEAEMQMYQAQINPHFLYNTLNSIQWMARTGKLKEVDGAIVQLVPLLQYSLKKQFFVTLKQEIEQTERYGYLQSIRYKGLIRVVLKIDSRVNLEEPCPKMIIQPIVENAIYHGLDPLPQGGRIAIRVEYTDLLTRVRIRIIDSGVGMTAEKCDKMNRMMARPEQAERHSGLINVVQRLHFYAETSAVMHCWSKPRVGTIIDISWERRG